MKKIENNKFSALEINKSQTTYGEAFVLGKTVTTSNKSRESLWPSWLEHSYHDHTHCPAQPIREVLPVSDVQGTQKICSESKSGWLSLGLCG
jgi:hypothetical protein